MAFLSFLFIYLINSIMFNQAYKNQMSYFILLSNMFILPLTLSLNLSLRHLI